MPAACARLPVTVRGELIQTGVSSGTGQTVVTPASGSRMMPLTKDERAEFGRPGLIATVASRHATPSMNPRREYSCTSSSAIAFAVPYDDCGLRTAFSGTTSGSGPPNTAMVLAKITRGARDRRRHASSRPRVASTFTCMPVSNSASDCPLNAAARWYTMSRPGSTIDRTKSGSVMVPVR